MIWIDGFTGWLTYRHIDRLTKLQTDLKYWQIDRLTDWQTDRMKDWNTERLKEWQIDGLKGKKDLTDRMTDRQTGV